MPLQIIRHDIKKMKVDAIVNTTNEEALSKYGLDCDRIMVYFGKWYYNDEFTPTGEMFDVGNTCSTAIEH